MFVLLAACSRNTFLLPTTDPGIAVREGPPMPVDRVWILEQAGPSPTDTTVTFSAALGRTVIVRHGPPDDAVYVVIEFPPATVVPRTGDSARVVVAPLPGRFGLALRTNDSLGVGVRMTFSYATHFQAPSDAIQRYPTATRFEQSMGAARMSDDGQVQFVNTTRPAADMIRFLVPGPGTYVLAAPR